MGLNIVLSHDLFSPFTPVNMSPAIAEPDEQRFRPALRLPLCKAQKSPLLSGDGRRRVI